MRNMRFPWWAGPIVGALAGLYIGAKVAAEEVAKKPAPHLSPTGCIVTGFAIGTAVGFLISLVEFSTLRSSDQETVSSSPSVSPVLDRFFALIGIGLFFVPVVGLVLNAIALVATRHERGRLRTASWIAAALSLVLSAIFLGIVLS